MFQNKKREYYLIIYIACFNMQACVIFTKVDLPQEDEQQRSNDFFVSGRAFSKFESKIHFPAIAIA
jgi:hypothetical protein